MKKLASVSISFCFSIIACNSKYIAAKNVGTNNCIDLLTNYSHYWIQDSLGKNGFRELLAEAHLSKCNFIGFKWSEISPLLGKPNFTFTHASEFHYRYRLNNYSDDLGAPGTLNLEIFVDDNIITSFKVDHVDG
jgi:hypothetical protein